MAGPILDHMLKHGPSTRNVGRTCDSTPWKSLKEIEHRHVKDIFKSRCGGHLEIKNERDSKPKGEGPSKIED